jgi:hypothetical protein
MPEQPVPDCSKYAPRHEIVQGAVARRNPAAYVEALVASRIMAGKEVKPEDVAEMVKFTGIAADPAKLLADATERAKTTAAIPGIDELSAHALLDMLAAVSESERPRCRLRRNNHVDQSVAAPRQPKPAPRSVSNELRELISNLRCPARTHGAAITPDAVIEAFLAVRIMTGKVVTVEETATIIRNVGLPTGSPASLIEGAKARIQRAGAHLGDRSLHSNLAAANPGYDETSPITDFLKFIGRIFNVFGADHDAAALAEVLREYDAAYCAILAGDFQGLSPYAGITIGEATQGTAAQAVKTASPTVSAGSNAEKSTPKSKAATGATEPDSQDDADLALKMEQLEAKLDNLLERINRDAFTPPSVPAPQPNVQNIARTGQRDETIAVPGASPSVEQGWHSAYAGRSLSKEEVVKEMALLTVCREYVFAVLGADRPNITLFPNGISMKHEGLNVVHFTPFPEALASFLATEFPLQWKTGKDAYGIYFPIDDGISPSLPSGEKLGRMLMYFRALRELIQICAARKCWPPDRMLVLHGILSPYASPVEMMEALKNAGINYLVILCAWDDEQVLGRQEVDDRTALDIAGTGCFCSIPVEKAIRIAVALNNGDRSSVASVFRLDHDYRENAWASNHPLLRQPAKPPTPPTPIAPGTAAQTASTAVSFGQQVGSADNTWLKGVQLLNPDAILCMESRPLSECKTISAAVLADPASQTTTVIMNESLAALANWQISDIRPQMNITEERPRLPQLVVHGDTMNQFNTVTEAHIMLVASDKKATTIRFPWNPDQFSILQQTRRWIFWSLPDETAKCKTYYWGYGDFDSAEAFEAYVDQRLDNVTARPAATIPQKQPSSPPAASPVSSTPPAVAVPPVANSGRGDPYTADEFRMLTTVTWNNLPKWLRAKAKRLGDDPWSKHGSPNRPFPYLPSQKLKGSDSSWRSGG